MEPITITVEAAKKALGIGTTTFYRLKNEGRIETVKLGRRTLVKTASVHALVAALEAA